MNTTRWKTARSPWGRHCDRRWATSAALRDLDSYYQWTKPWRKLPSICPVADILYSKANSIATKLASFRRNWYRTSFVHWQRVWARRSTSKSRARIRITWLRRASRDWAVRFARLSELKARNCLLARAFSNAIGHH